MRELAPFGVTVGLLGALTACSSVNAQNVQQSSPSGGITIGPTVNISAQRSGVEHVEVVADGDTVHPGRLIACSMFQTRPVEKIRTAAYVSTDGGKTWSGKVAAPGGSWDPDCHIAQNGDMYFASNAGQDIDPSKLPKSQRHARTYIALWKSTNGGQSFTGPMNFAKGQAYDREWIAVDDQARSPHRGRIYAWYFHDATIKPSPQGGVVNQTGGSPMEDGLMHSENGGKTWSAPLHIPFRANDAFMSHAAVLADGTLLLVEGRVSKQDVTGDPDRSNHIPDASIIAMLSHDGGVSLSAPIKIADVHIAQAANTRTVPTIAVDRSNGPFAGRIYATWSDAGSGRSVPMISRSGDNGKSWSTPVGISDDFWNKDNERGPDNFMPTITVNNKGVAGVIWYDRRNDPDDVGYDVRFSASRDGGDTWSPSVAIPGAHNSFETDEYPTFWPTIVDGSKTKDVTTVTLQDGTWYIGGHTAGIGSTADGVFHPVWVDNHTRVQQLYTAPVTVNENAVRNGDANLAALADLTKRVHVEIIHPVYDRPSGTISVQVRLQNTGSKALRGPLYLRAIDWSSDLSLAQATNSDNKQSTRGAYWIYNSASLAPQAFTAWRTLTFHVSGVQSLHRDRQYFRSFLTLNARVLGKSS